MFVLRVIGKLLYSSSTWWPLTIVNISAADSPTFSY